MAWQPAGKHYFPYLHIKFCFVPCAVCIFDIRNLRLLKASGPASSYIPNQTCTRPLTAIFPTITSPTIYIMRYCLSCAGESSMAMAIGKVSSTADFTFSQNYTVKFIHRILADLLKAACPCYLLELVEFQCSPEDLEQLEHFYVSYSCSQGDHFFMFMILL